MQEYPYFSPQVMNDSVFLSYGGMTGSSTQAQRNAAYLLAEEQITEHLSCFLVPTIITGTAFWRGGSLFETEFGRVRRVLLVSAEEIKNLNPLQTTIVTGSAMVRNSEVGYLDLVFPCPNGMIYSNTVVYESGFASGTVTGPSILAALTLASQINLNGWVQDLSNEGVADVGIQSFSNQSYSENRVKLGRTAFGSSAMAQGVAKLVRKYRTKPAMAFR